MPVVRRIREIEQAPIPGVRKTAAETANSRGFALQQALGNKGDAIAQAGGMAARIGIAKLNEIQKEERDKADQIAALAFDNKFAKWEASRLYDPETGALAQKGKNALDLPEKVEEEFTKLSGEIEATATTDRQREAFQRIKSQRQQGLNVTVRRHVFGEMQAYGREELAGTVENAHNAAVAKALDPDAAGVEMARGITAIKDVGPKLGLGPQAIEKQVGAFQSKTIDGVVTRLLTNGFDKQAKAYFEDAKEKGLITDGDTLGQIEAKVKRGTTDANGERAAAAIWESLGPKGDKDPISIDRMETAAREKWGDDTDSLKATISALRSRKQGVADGRREREDAVNSTLWGAVNEGTPLAALRRTPAYVNAPGEVQTRISDYYDNEAARAESRAATRESRGAAAESRAQQKEFREERARELKGWAAVLDLKADPATLRAMSPGDILKQLPEIGHANVNRLIEEREKLVKDEATFRAAVIDRDLFNEVMHDAGVPGVYAAPGGRSAAQKADLGKLLSTIEEAIGRKQIASGRRLTREETEKVARETVDAKVMVKDGWFSNDVRFPALVNLTDVPAAAVPRIKAALAARGITEPSDQDIIDNYILALPKVKR